MAIVAGFDVHRRQITFDALDTETGEVSRGRIDATPAAVTAWARRFEGEVRVAVEACTGWLFVCDALTAACAEPYLAEPVEARALRASVGMAPERREVAYEVGSTTLVTTQRCLPILRSRTNPSFS
jgi:hypothetical protein